MSLPKYLSEKKKMKSHVRSISPLVLDHHSNTSFHTKFPRPLTDDKTSLFLVTYMFRRLPKRRFTFETPYVSVVYFRKSSHTTSHPQVIIVTPRPPLGDPELDDSLTTTITYVSEGPMT